MINTNNTVREDSMEELREMYNYFSVKADAYDELERLERHISQGVRIGKAGKVLGILLIILGGIVAVVGYSLGSVAGIIGLLISGLGVYMIVSRSKNYNKQVRTIAEEQQRLGELADELILHYNNYGPCPIGIEYTDPKSLEAIYEVIRQGRADTPKEAINLLGHDAHFAEMERLQRETAQAAWQTCAASRATAGFAAASYFHQVNRDS